MEGVLYAGPDYVVERASVNSTTQDEEEMMPSTSDTYASYQWALNKIQLPKCWDFSIGTQEVFVGVVDSGIDGLHEDLQGVLDSSLHRNFLEEEPIVEVVPIDTSGHGTSVAGIIGAIGDNSKGIAGICWNVKLISLKVLNSDGSGFMSDVIEAINFAEENDITMLNLSLTTYNADVVALENAINSYSGLVMCAAGNDNNNNDLNPGLPASLNCDNIISVGASNHNDVRWIDGTLGTQSGYISASNYGKSTVDIFAPGDNVYTTTCNNSYGMFNATSAATSHVTGVVALIKSLNLNLTNQEIKTAIIQNASQCINIMNGASVEGEAYIGKRLNAYRAIKSILSQYGTEIQLENGVFTRDGVFAGKIVVLEDNDYTFFVQTDNFIDISILNEEFVEIEVEKIRFDNEYKVKINLSLCNGVYYVFVKHVQQTSITSVTFSVYNLSLHIHEYTNCMMDYDNVSHVTSLCECGDCITENHDFSYFYGSNTINSHKAFCICGCYEVEPHVVTKQDMSKCLICGCLAGAGSMIVQSVIKCTKNGSFILSDGVIVLDDRDIDEYFDGTLVFYSYDLETN